MAEGAPELEPLVKRGVTELHEWLGEGSLFLSESAKRAGEAHAVQYPLPSDFSGVERTVRIGFPQGFPEHALQLSVEPSPWLLWPHAMPSSICLFGSRQRPASASPEEQIRQTMSRLARLVELVMPDADPCERQREMDQEITSYWNQQVKARSTQLILLQRPEEACRLFALTDDQRPASARPSHWLSESKSALERHLDRMRGITRNMREPACAGFYLPLRSAPHARLPLPAGLRDWLWGHTHDSNVAGFEDWLADSSVLPVRWLVLGLPDDSSGHYAFALCGAGTKKGLDRSYGCRAGRISSAAGSRTSTVARIEGSRVHVLDRKQVHSRNPGNPSDNLSSKHIVVIGTGSLGSLILSPLARSGLGRMTLIDPDRLEDANLGRHILGMDHLGRYKVEALRERLQQDVPSLEVTALPGSFQATWDKHKELINSASLILITTADWPSEAAVWRVKSQGAEWSLIHAWSEPFAHIGHALSAPNGAHDARPLFDSTGGFKYKMSRWPENGVVPLPGCGESFIPGGPTSLSIIATTIARIAVNNLLEPARSASWHSSIDSPEGIHTAGGSYIGPELPERTSHLVLERPWPDAERSAA